MIQHWEAKLNALNLDDDTTATDFINFFEMWVRIIEKMDGAWSDSKKKREIKSRIKDEAYETEVRTHTGTYQDLIDSLRTREQELLKESLGQGKLTRRFKREEPHDDSKSNSRASHDVPFLPQFLIRSLDPAARKKSSDGGCKFQISLSWRRLKSQLKRSQVTRGRPQMIEKRAISNVG